MSLADLAIAVRGLTKRFDDRVVVDGIDLEVPRGRICGFLGPNGSGKTTTLRMLCGLLTPDAGEGTCLGFDVRSQAHAIKPRVGYMTQKFGLYEDLSIEENLYFAARIYGLDRVRQRVQDALQRLGLVARARQLAGQLSGGWKQRLALAACLLHEPQLLLLDEPTAGVDPKARREFWEQLHSLAEQGVTILVSTHYMDEAERCHLITYIAYGKVLAHGTVKDLLQSSRLRTWEVFGSDQQRLARTLGASDQADRWRAVPFGSRLHVTSTDGTDLAPWLADQGFDVQATEIESSLEDLFISLMSTNQPLAAEPRG
ncbi:MAG TPA: ABC transporter ATP-binding protein [Burkholderiaceae bacterium]|nr:ABC transporter ATP-binding protein [Burkholderiaceae bacterium]